MRTVAAPLLAIAGGILAACTSVRDEPSDVPTLSVENHDFEVWRHIGRTVRVCGRVVQRESRWAIEHVPVPSDFFLHGLPAVLVVPCGNRPRPVDGDGCLTGRIARENGSLDPLTGRIIQDDSPRDLYWFLHEQCPTAAQLN